jgi:pimeloyl-ACP methyl ester carboxylesterase
MHEYDRERAQSRRWVSMTNPAGNGDPIDERRERVAGWRTRLLQVDGDGPRLILLHGFSDSADTWRPLLRLLAQRGCAATAVDLPSHGLADSLDGSRPVLPQFNRFVTHVVRHCAPDGAIVVGNSLGGLVALQLAETLTASSGLSPIGVVGVCPAGFSYAPWMTTGAGWLRRSGLRRAITATVAAPPVWMVNRAARTGIRRTLADRHGVEPGFGPSYAGHLSSRAARSRLATLVYRLIDESVTPPLRPERIDCPVMVVWGEHDPLVPAASQRMLLDAAPGIHSEVLPGIGHMPQLEAPDHLVDILSRFRDRATHDAPSTP